MKLIERAIAQTTKNDWYNIIKPAPAGSGDFTNIFSRIIDFILIIAGALAVIYLIYSGILYITAAGNPDAAKKGQQGVINAVIGIIIIVLVFVIIRVVSNFARQAGGA